MRAVRNFKTVWPTMLVILALQACQMTPTAASNTPVPAATPTNTTAPTGWEEHSSTAAPTRSPVISGTSTATPTLDAASLPHLWIAFLRPGPDQPWTLGPGIEELWVMDASGANQRLVATYTHEYFGELGAFSPDGCYYAASDGQNGVLIDIRTGEKTVFDTSDLDNGRVTQFAWSPSGVTLNYHRGYPSFHVSMTGTGPAPEVRQIDLLPDGSLSERRVYPLVSEYPFLVPALALDDGRLLMRIDAAERITHIANPSTGAVSWLTVDGTGQKVEVTDVTPDGRVLFQHLHEDFTKPWDSYVRVGQIAPQGAITNVVLLSPPTENEYLFAARFTPDYQGVLAWLQHGTHGGGKEYGVFRSIDPSAEFTPLLRSNETFWGHTALGLTHAVVAVSPHYEALPKQLWLVALDGSVAINLGPGYFPMAIPTCEG